MSTITIPKKLIKERELVLIPRREYEEFSRLREAMRKLLGEERNTDRAIRIYKREKRRGALRTIASLADLEKS